MRRLVLLAAAAAALSAAPAAHAATFDFGTTDCFCSGAALAPDGSVWTTEPDRVRVLHYSPGGQLTGSFAISGAPGFRPVAVAVAPSGELVVTDGYYGAIVVTQAGQFVRRLTTDGADDVAVDAAGTAWLVDGGAAVEAVPVAGGVVRRIDDPAYGFQRLTGVGYDSTTGDVELADADAARIVVLHQDGTLARTFGAAGQLTEPLDVAVGPDGSAFVSQVVRTTASPPLVKFDPAGGEVGRYGLVREAPRPGLAATGHALYVPISRGLRYVDLDHPRIPVSPLVSYRSAGTQIHFSAAGTVAPFDTVASYRWDFDGDGVIDEDTGPSPEVDHRYLLPGEYQMFVTAIGAHGTQGTDYARVWINSVGAQLAVAPSLLLSGMTATLDASRPDAPENPVTNVRWDLDGDGTYETDTGTARTTQTTFTTRGVHAVGVRLTRGGGVVDEARVDVPVHPKPPAGRPGVTIDDGARFTNDPHVTLDIVWPAGADTLLAANDGGFNGVRRRPLDEHVAFTLDGSGSERLPKTVYVRFDDSTQTFQDDIVLDQTDPAVRSAQVAPAPAGARAAARHRYRVRLRATDRTSGVAYAQFATRRAHPAKRVRYHSALTVRSASRPLWVRVRDRAGNDSRWRRLATR